MEQAPIGQSQPAAVPGRADITAEHDGATYAFSTGANRATFLSDPENYAPQYDGHRALGVAKGSKVPGNPNLWRIVDGKLYLDITKNVVGFREADIPGNLSTSEGNWPAPEPSTRSATDVNRNLCRKCRGDPPPAPGAS